jgi:cryptochrome 1
LNGVESRAGILNGWADKTSFFPGKILSCSAEELGLEDSSEKSSNALLARAWCPGWSYANKSLEAFLQGSLLEYATNRQKVDGVTTSLLSPHLHFGELSVRKLFYEVRTKQVTWTREANAVGEQNVTLFLRSIGFREYSRYLSFHFPFTHERSLLANLKSFPWRMDEAYFKAWRQGRTGYPLVDAGMRELWATGWLHNQIRIVVSSFFVKFLQLPWRWGMKYFWDTLLDADLECDVLGWQYISGSLPDGHELDRMDNPQVEGYRFDPDGEYVRRWLPELSRLPTEWIHHPWDAPLTALRAAGVELGTNYPRPIVEMGVARERLQASLAEMWEREAASKAILANGLEEGLGETTEVPGTGGPFHERMDVHTVVVRQLPAHSGSFLRDRLVPVLPTTSQLQAAASILHQSMPVEEDIEEAVAALPPSVPSASADLSIAGHSRPLEGHVQGLADRSQSGRAAAPRLDLDFNSTAESGVGESAESDGRAVPVWSPSVLSHAQLQASAECVVPEIANVRRGSFSRRLTQSMLRANQEVIVPTRLDNL